MNHEDWSQKKKPAKPFNGSSAVFLLHSCSFSCMRFSPHFCCFCGEVTVSPTRQSKILFCFLVLGHFTASAGPGSVCGSLCRDFCLVGRASLGMVLLGLAGVVRNSCWQEDAFLSTQALAEQGVCYCTVLTVLSVWWPLWLQQLFLTVWLKKMKGVFVFFWVCGFCVLVFFVVSSFWWYTILPVL